MKKFLVQGICFNEKIVANLCYFLHAGYSNLHKYPFSKDVFLYEIPRIENVKNIKLKRSKKISNIAREQFNKNDYDRASYESGASLKSR